MEEISYDNIDLFYYHSIDIDFARFYSILNHGIVSQKAAIDEGINYYYRNYTHSSSRDEFVSINHFPRTVFRYYKIENELYDFNTNKICFIIDDVDALEKQVCNNRKKYTNERHVHYKIDTNQIKGILLRDVDAQKTVKDISFNYKFTDKSFFEHKVFLTVDFFEKLFDGFDNLNKIYYLIGKLHQAQFYGADEDLVTELIAIEIRSSIQDRLSEVTKIENPTLLDSITYINNNRFPIYIMNRYDIQKAGYELLQSDLRLKKIEEMSIPISKLKEKEKFDKQTIKLLRKMSSAGLEIYYGYSSGPYTKEDQDIADKIKCLKKVIDK